MLGCEIKKLLVLLTVDAVLHQTRRHDYVVVGVISLVRVVVVVWLQARERDVVDRKRDQALVVVASIIRARSRELDFVVVGLLARAVEP